MATKEIKGFVVWDVRKCCPIEYNPQRIFEFEEEIHTFIKMNYTGDPAQLKIPAGCKDGKPAYVPASATLTIEIPEDL